MKLMALWFKDGEEVYRVSPVSNIVCYDNMEDVSKIEINDGHMWHTYESFDGDADDFVIMVAKN